MKYLDEIVTNMANHLKADVVNIEAKSRQADSINLKTESGFRKSHYIDLIRLMGNNKNRMMVLIGKALIRAGAQKDEIRAALDTFKLVEN